MLTGHEPHTYKTLYKVFPNPDPNKSQLSPLGHYLWVAVEAIKWPQKHSEMWKIKEELDEIRKNSNLTFEEIVEGFKLALNVCCEKAHPSVIKEQHFRFNSLLSIDTDIPYGAIEF